MTYESAAALFGQYPWPECPRRLVPDVTAVAAVQVGNPITVFILMKTNDGSFHSVPLRPKPAHSQARPW